MAKETVEKKKAKDIVELPAGAKFILVFEHGGKLGMQSGGFMNIDEMLGFNRRCVNPNLVEQLIIVAGQKQSQEQAEAAQKPRAIDKPPNPGAAVQDKKK